nr:heterogeneous nuclear ribonucleoprotein 1-like [Quercus suber]
MESTNGRLSEDTLRKHFSNYGEVEEALILSDTDRGNETGFGYVAFKDPAGPIHALNQQHYILDTKVNVKPALWISSVTSLNKNTPPTEYFESFGVVTNARVVYDEENKKSRGFEFVTFDSEDVVHNVLQKSYLEMENRLQMVGRADSDRNQGLIYTYDCNNTCLGSGRSDSETYGPYPPPAPQPPYAPPCGN